MACEGFIQPLDLECLLVNTFAGSMEIFMFFAFVAIAGLGAYFRMLNSALLVMFVLFAIIMGQYMQGIYFLVTLITGLVAATLITRIVR